MASSCVICQNNAHQQLECGHCTCINCILKLYNDQHISCPICRKNINVQEIVVKTGKCARCNSIGMDIHLCQSCDNFLCGSCWTIIHSFPPIDLHKKHELTLDQKAIILDNLNASKKLQEEIDTVKKAFDDDQKSQSLRRRYIGQIIDVCHKLREQINEQELNALTYLDEITEEKLNACYEMEDKINSYMEDCIKRFFNKHHNMECELPDMNVNTSVDLKIDSDYKLPQIVKFQMPSPILITESGKFIPNYSGRAKIICVGGGAGSGRGGTEYQGGGGSGYITENICYLKRNVSIEVEIGAGGKATVNQGAASNGGITKFGEVSAEGGQACNSLLKGGDGGSGGGCGCAAQPTYTAGRGGSCGSDGESSMQWKGGYGQGNEIFKSLERYGILPGTGGAPGGPGIHGHQGGGGAGGVLFGETTIQAQNGTGPEGSNYGHGGTGYGAGAGGGSYNNFYNTGGDGAPGCVIVIFENE